ncbi:hypothetical protein EPA93_38100 [Ktedonosporobacter rubrisoli]|uniref:Uncharacterized protein n=1 Tax=Ktedonosporobacter rubrisoli TaxID=2509675 RepID=A0A4P6K0Y2_KTERU|nr:hypothetical protein [Ktedonosporobacter rubrisoli]QBD81473.1 hypothetical protein EPA93_38100 [Ktedonosporobacter rubrisoli]
MQSTTPPTQQVKTPPQLRRVRSQPGNLYNLILLNQRDRIIVPLTEWHCLRNDQGSRSIRRASFACLQLHSAFYPESGCPRNTPPKRLHQTLIAFHNDRLKCLIPPQRASDIIALTRESPMRESAFKVMCAALHGFFLVKRKVGLYVFASPLSSNVLAALKREQAHILANKSAPNQARYGKRPTPIRDP